MLQIYLTYRTTSSFFSEKDIHAEKERVAVEKKYHNSINLAEVIRNLLESGIKDDPIVIDPKELIISYTEVREVRYIFVHDLETFIKNHAFLNVYYNDTEKRFYIDDVND